jgi:hypothetical protein
VQQNGEVSLVVAILGLRRCSGRGVFPLLRGSAGASLQGPRPRPLVLGGLPRRLAVVAVGAVPWLLLPVRRPCGRRGRGLLPRGWSALPAVEVLSWVVIIGPGGELEWRLSSVVCVG